MERRLFARPPWRHYLRRDLRRAPCGQWLPVPDTTNRWQPFLRGQQIVGQREPITGQRRGPRRRRSPGLLLGPTAGEEIGWERKF